MKKCDVIIPVYKSPEWVKLCVYALIKNTKKDDLNKIYLINDCIDNLTNNCLNNLKNKYSEIIEIVQNEENLGFVKTTNRGMKLSKAPFVLLLNTDCIISNNTIGKLIGHIEKDSEIGLISPISNNAANVSLPMFDGFTYSMMNKLLEEKFLYKNFDACTIVGNCLMISRDCINKTGYLDEIYGTGYGEETDYQFKAMKQGFKAKIAIDTYVFHKAEVSFGTSKEKLAKLEKNRAIFFERWGNEYYKEYDKYKDNDPIMYINNNLTNKDKKPHHKFLLYLMGLVQNAGGVHMSVDMINYLTINDFNCNIVYSINNDYKEIMLFNPITTNDLNKVYFDKIVATIYLSVFYAREIANNYKIPMIYFAQGYEPYFENGSVYGIAEISYKLADKVLTISNYLKDMYKTNFNIESNVVSNGVNYDILYKENTNKIPSVITIILRGNVLKGDFILLEVLKKITKKFNNLKINLLCNDKKIVLPFNENKTIKINKKFGFYTRKELAEIMQETDIYLDASLTEGFGLIGLEAMTAGAIPIVSNSGGINEYIKNNVNGFIINEINNPDVYIEKITLLLDDSNKYIKMKKEARKTSELFDYDKKIDEYINFFDSEDSIKNVILDEEEEKVYNYVLDKYFKVNKDNKGKNLLYKICKKVPLSWRIKLKKQVEKLYKFTNDR